MSVSMREWIFYESAGRYSVDLGDSNVDFLPVSEICDVQEIAGLILDYGNEAGLPALREAVAKSYPNVCAENVLICHGAQEAFTLLIRSLPLSAESDVIVLGSGWLQHREFPMDMGFSVKEVPIDHISDDILLDRVRSSWTENTKAIIVASPDNPTGRICSRAVLVSLAELAHRHGVLLIVDEEYVMHHSDSVACLNEFVAIISGLSKMHGVPGLRIGWCVTSPGRIKECARHKHLTTIANSVLCEAIALAALTHNEKLIARAEALCSKGAAALQSWAKGVETISAVHASENLPFAWVELSEGIDSLALARRALEDGILVAPGEVFDRPGYLRISVGRDLETLMTGLNVIGRILTEPCSGQLVAAEG